MKSKRLGMIVGLLVLCPLMAEAAEEGAKYTLSLTKDYTPSMWTMENGYFDRAGHKLVFGAKNTLLGCTELYKEPHEAVQEHEGFFRGMGRGVVNMLGDTVGGALHLATFPITAVDVPLPEGGV